MPDGESAGLRASSTTVRRFEPGDVPALTMMLHRAYAELGRTGLNFTAVDQPEETTARRAGGGSSWVVVDDDGAGQIVAAMTMTLPPESGLQAISAEAAVPGRAWLNQLAVDPSRRGEGLAGRLWAVGRGWASRRGAEAVGLDTAVPATHLVDMYRRWGFEQRETVQWLGKTYQSTIMILDLAGPRGSAV